MNDGEKVVTKAIRNAGYALVVMMLDGFPPEGSETASFYNYYEKLFTSSLFALKTSIYWACEGEEFVTTLH